MIFKYLTREISSDEEVELKEWLDEDPLNRQSLAKLESFYSNTNSEINSMKKKIWVEVNSRLEQDDHKEVPIVNIRYPYMLRIAAVLIFTVVTTFVIMRLVSDGNSVDLVENKLIQKSTALGEKTAVKLPDGTIVNLNSGSTLSYPASFSAGAREVEISGECFFDVVRDIQRPFVVKFKTSSVTVLGTSFNIRTYKGESRISVAVASGKVSFQSSLDEPGVILEANEAAMYDDENLVRREIDPLEAFGWKDQVLYFNNRPFDEIIPELERWFGVTFEVQGDFSKKGNFSGKFKDKSLENVLMGLSYLYEFQFEINEDKKVILK